MRLLATLTAVLACCGAAAATRCFACRPDHPLSGFETWPGLSGRPACSEMGPAIDERFAVECDATGRGCLSVRRGGQVLRGCFPAAIDECHGSMCFCTGDLCNGVTSPVKVEVDRFVWSMSGAGATGASAVAVLLGLLLAW